MLRTCKLMHTIQVYMYKFCEGGVACNHSYILSWPDKLHVLALMECISISFAGPIAIICMHIDMTLLYLI